MGWAEDRARLLGQAVETPPALRCVIGGCDGHVKEGDLVYCARHREMADDGTLWLRCVYGSGHAPVAPNDPIACAEHRQLIDAELARFRAAGAGPMTGAQGGAE